MKKAALIILTCLLTISCEKNSLNDQYSFLYGDWTPTQLSAGMMYTADPHNLGDIVQFIKDDSYKIIRNDIVVERGKINIDNQTEDNLTLTFDAKDYNPLDQSSIRLSRFSLILHVYTQDSISLGNLATDGGYFGLLLIRKK